MTAFLSKRRVWNVFNNSVLYPKPLYLQTGRNEYSNYLSIMFFNPISKLVIAPIVKIFLINVSFKKSG